MSALRMHGELVRSPQSRCLLCLRHTGSRTDATPLPVGHHGDSYSLLIRSNGPPFDLILTISNEPPTKTVPSAETKDTDKLIAGHRIIKLGNVTSPEAHVYLPPKNKQTGAAVVICPGGGFSILAWALEGTEVAQWLNTLGVAGIVLKYCVPTRDQDPRWKAPVQDTQRTMSLVRHNAKKWGAHRSAHVG